MTDSIFVVLVLELLSDVPCYGNEQAMYKPLRSSRLYEEIVNHIRQQILNQTLKDRDRLPGENELARQYNVSRTVVREAMKALVKDGLVEVQQGPGTFISDNTSRSLGNVLNSMLSFGENRKIGDLLEIRELLEPGIAERAAYRATDDDVARLQIAFQKMSDNVSDPDTYFTADYEFHLALAATNNNTLTFKVIEPILHVTILRRLNLKICGEAESCLYHHGWILEAVKLHDSQVARRAMLDHLEQVREQLSRETLMSA